MAEAQRRRVLVLTQHYHPEPNFITADVAEALAADFDVTVVTAHPNYPEGRFYSGTRPWRPLRRVERGVTVWRVPMYPYHGRPQVKRCLSYSSFALVAAVWAPFVGRAGRMSCGRITGRLRRWRDPLKRDQAEC